MRSHLIADTQDHDTGRRETAALAVRSYSRISKILLQKDGMVISPAHVRRICLDAEAKLACALMAEITGRDPAPRTDRSPSRPLNPRARPDWCNS